MSAEVINFGCRLNLAEGEAIRAGLADADDLIVVNSCAVTAEAARQARQAIRRAARTRPGARIVVTGCAAEVERERFEAMLEVAGIVSNDQKFSPQSYTPFGLSLSKPSLSSAKVENRRKEGASTSSAQTALGGWDRPEDRKPAVSGAGHARAFVEVQNGCDHDCTFCVTTLARGESRSIGSDAVIQAVRGAVERGCREAVLTGIDLTSYGADLPDTPVLGRLVARLLDAVPELPRLRLSSLDPAAVDPELIELIAHESRVMPHVHLSLQAGDALTLKRMKRRHSPGDAIALVERLKAARPEIAVGADLIAGFPTETEAMFANSLAIADACDVVFGHVFPYSPRPGTVAARMPQVEPEIRKARAARLRGAIAARKAGWLDTLVGGTQQVLVELDGAGGHAANFAKVALAAPAPPRSIQTVRITASDGHTLTGIPA